MSVLDKPRISGRNSSLELLKIVGVFCIIISHVIQTLGTNGTHYVSFNDYYYNISAASLDVQHVIISILRYGGVFGNTVFLLAQLGFCSIRMIIRKRNL